MDKLRRKISWQEGKEKKGYSLVKWSTVMLNKESGGLGIRNLMIQNKSLLMKWLWRYTSKERALSKEVIVAKYGELNPWCTETVSDPYGWVGNDYKIKFWRDGWIDRTPSNISFPNLFLISTNPEMRVSECWTTQGWDLFFRRLLNDWEMDRVAALLEK
ncbi:unnamed protein product [Withania somnifera]